MADDTMEEVMEFVEENDVKFIRLAFCDIFGNQKNISIMPEELRTAFTTGINFDSFLILGYDDPVYQDLYLKPVPDTLNVLPWRPQPVTGRLPETALDCPALHHRHHPAYRSPLEYYPG